MKRKAASRKYVARPNSTITDEDAEVIGSALDSIEKSGAPITPDALVEAARRDNGKLHALFNWDRDAAAHAHWISHARKLIASVCILEFRSHEPKKAFMSVVLQSDDGKSVRQYAARRTVLLDMSDELQQVSNACYRRIMAEVDTIVGLELHKKDSGWAKIVEALQLNAPSSTCVEA